MQQEMIEEMVGTLNKAAGKGMCIPEMNALLCWIILMLNYNQTHNLDTASEEIWGAMEAVYDQLSGSPPQVLPPRRQLH